MVSKDYIYQLHYCRDCLSKSLKVNISPKNVKGLTTTGVCANCLERKRIVREVSLITRLKAKE